MSDNLAIIHDMTVHKPKPPVIQITAQIERVFTGPHGYYEELCNEAIPHIPGETVEHLLDRIGIKLKHESVVIRYSITPTERESSASNYNNELPF